MAMAGKQDLGSQAEKIEALLKIVDNSKDSKADQERLNYQERRFFFKHPDMVSEVLDGNRRHVRVSAIVRKMSHHGLGIGDVDAIWQVLDRRKKAS